MLDATNKSDDGDYAYASAILPSKPESIRVATDFLVQAARNMHVPSASDSLFESAIAEAINNAVEHGNIAKCPRASIVCELELVKHRLTVRILDHGPGFTLPQSAPVEWKPDDMTTVPEGGFGITIIQTVFPVVRTIAHRGAFGIELALTF